ncbi:hypothetical protein ACEWPN_05380 [Yoonia sp. R2-816]
MPRIKIPTPGRFLISRAAAICGMIALQSQAPTAALGAENSEGDDSIQDFLFLGGAAVTDYINIVQRPDIEGIQVVYSWRQLEPEKGRYDFSKIERDLAIAEAEGKLFFLQLQDRFFLPTARNVPDYLMTEPIYEGGIIQQRDNAGEGEPEGSGWVSRQWLPSVRERHQVLVTALAEAFDGRIYGLNLPETAIELGETPQSHTFSCDGYFEGQMENLAHARAAFETTLIVQYVNFWPCEWNNDQGYMSRIFEFAAANDIGLGGPDIIPHRRGQMKNSYPFFNQYKTQLSVIAMGVQQPTLTYENPKTGKAFTEEDFRNFATDYLGVDIIFWTVEAPWLRP